MYMSCIYIYIYIHIYIYIYIYMAACCPICVCWPSNCWAVLAMV